MAGEACPWEEREVTMEVMSFEGYVRGYRQLQVERRLKREEERQRLIERVRALSGYFDSLSGLERVYVFGSVAVPGRFTSMSDVDLAFEGLPPERFCSVLSELVERLERSVDGVVDLDYPSAGLTWRLTCPAANALEPGERESNLMGRGKSN